ncbi:MAG: MATE family efflux transporter [Bacteroidaceae bacterium]|nr:MATE family efflux transporter [Bacteroidaceae bacterium]
MDKNEKYIQLGKEPITKLLFQYALPSIIAMTAASLYNIIDSIFIGQGVGALAISGLAVTFPFMNLTAAFGAMIGAGASTLVSIKLGEKDYKTAQNILGNTLVLNLFFGAITMILCLLFIDPILFFFGASENTIEYARSYMQVLLAGNIITHVYFGLNALLRASGYPSKAMLATIITVVLDCILDAIFIFVLDWGIRGAALATVLAQSTSLIWLLYILSDSKKLLHFKKGIYTLKKRIIKEILYIGLSPFFMNVAACLIVIVINNALKDAGGDLAIGAYGIINRIIFLILMVVMGLNQGMQPIAGYNYGARQYHRLNQVLTTTIVIASIVSTLGFIIGELFPGTIVSLFTTDKELVALATEGMKIYVIGFPLVGFQVVVSNFFQSIGQAHKSILLSLSRQVFILLPCLFILPHFYGVAGVWYSMPIADISSSLLSAALLFWQFRAFKKMGNLQAAEVNS